MGCSSSLGYERRRGSTSLGYGLLGAGSSSDYGLLGLRARWPSSSPRSAVACSVSGRAPVRRAFFLNGPSAGPPSFWRRYRGTLLDLMLTDRRQRDATAASATLPPRERDGIRSPGATRRSGLHRDLGLMCEGETWTV